MRYLMNIKADKVRKPGPPDSKLMAAIAKLGEEMTRAGKMLITGGLNPFAPSTGIKAANGELTLVDGPFAETKELIAGFAIFEVASKEEAIEHGKRFMRLHQEILGPSWTGEMEIHEIMGG
ncbi:MAG: YciI family protein [Polyangiales bacterium]